MKKGFIRLVILIIIALVVLKLAFNFDVIEKLGSAKIQHIFNFIIEGIKLGWQIVVDVLRITWGFVLSIFDKIPESTVE
ncbi:MAG: hypothetical protein MRY49_03580 [Candidatus Pacebacteria bacterium]|nr:hypothetical protein [Candidatus Paceibacterota bacterium]